MIRERNNHVTQKRLPLFGKFYEIGSVSKFRAVAICLLWASALATVGHATTIVVNNTNDDGLGSLRQGLVSASDGDTIDATGISGVITLATGELVVNTSVVINGAGADLLAVDGNAASVVFQISVAKTVTISGLTMRNGQGNFGGGILNGAGGALTITNSTLSGNTAAFGGGAFNSGTMTITNSTVSGNTGGEGAGIYNAGGSVATITDSTFSGNTVTQTGGACFNLGTLQITNSTFSDNSAAFLAGGVFNLDTLEIGNTVLNRGDSGVNIYSNGGTVTSLGYNVSSDDADGFLTGTGDQLNTDPLLGPLQNNGGSTFTHALLPGSPAIDMGDPNFIPPPFFDQRGTGFDRVVNGRIDVGAFELQTQTAINLKAAGRKVGGINTVRLTWSGATSSNIDVFRDGVLVATVPNTGADTDSTGDTGRARYNYDVCESDSSTCSNNARVTFRQ